MSNITNIQEYLCHWSVQHNRDSYVLNWKENGVNYSKHFRFPWQRESFKKLLIKTDSTREAIIPILKKIYSK